MTTDVYVAQRWIVIPEVVGMTVREATARLAGAGLTPAASPRRFSADAGDVVGGTLPPEGTSLQRTARIDLLPVRKDAVARAADEDLAGFTVNEALAIVQGHGFHTWPRGAFTDDVEPDFVVTTDPRPGFPMNFEPITIWYAVPVPPPDPPRDPLTDLTPVLPPGTPTPLEP
jgi:hypothetical protein